MTVEPVDRCQCGAWVYTAKQCSVCYTEATQDERKELAIKRLLGNILREQNPNLARSWQGQS